jgi:Prp8 binding protein
MDGTVRKWDIRPFAPVDRHIKTFDGASSGLEKNLLKASWDPKGERIAAGSEDRTVLIWDSRSGKLLYKLPGHKGSVNDVRFHPGSEPISEFSSSTVPSYARLHGSLSYKYYRDRVNSYSSRVWFIGPYFDAG